MDRFSFVQNSERSVVIMARRASERNARIILENGTEIIVPESVAIRIGGADPRENGCFSCVFCFLSCDSGSTSPFSGSPGKRRRWIKYRI